MGIALPQSGEYGLDSFLGNFAGCRCSFFIVRLGAVDVDTIGGRIVGHPEVHRFTDVPELHIVAAADTVGSHGYSLSIHIDGLAAQRSGDAGCGLGRWATQCEASQHSDPHKNRFSFPASHRGISLQYGVALGKQHHTEEPLGSRELFENRV